MDTSEHDQSGSDWMIAHHLKHQISGVTAGTPDSSISASQAIPVNSYPCRSILMLDSFIPMASNENNTPRKANSINCTPTVKPVAVSSRGLFLPTIPTILTPSPSHSPNDFSGMIHSTVPCPSMTPCSNVSKDFIGTRLQKIVLNIPETRGASVFHHHESRNESSIKNYINKESSSNMLPVNDPCRTNVTEGSQETNINLAEASDYLCPIDLGEKKMKKADQGREICNQVHTKEKRNRKTSNKHFKDHLNARARSRQAANSHNIAERLRRERISERLRYLQNLVPGCTKVTGKALMLDEIINYVQSLQQQVEFLSMKLAAVYPPENYTIGWLHAKVLHACDDTSLETGLPQEMFHPDLHPSQQDFAPISVSSLIHSSWDQELNDIMDIADGTNAQEKLVNVSSMVPLCRDTTLLS